MHLHILAASLQAVRSTGYLPSLSTFEAMLVVAWHKGQVCTHADLVQSLKVSPASVSTLIKQLVAARMCKRARSADGKNGVLLDEDGENLIKGVNRAVGAVIAPHLSKKKGAKKA